MKYHVTIPSGRGMDLPGFGRTLFMNGYSISADSEAEAIRLARERHEREGGSVVGKATVEQFQRWEITFRERADKRKRSTFIVDTPMSEKAAISEGRAKAQHRAGFEFTPCKVVHVGPTP